MVGSLGQHDWAVSERIGYRRLVCLKAVVTPTINYLSLGIKCCYLRMNS